MVFKLVYVNCPAELKRPFFSYFSHDTKTYALHFSWYQINFGSFRSVDQSVKIAWWMKSVLKSKSRTNHDMFTVLVEPPVIHAYATKQISPCKRWKHLIKWLSIRALYHDKAFMETKMELCHSLSLLNAFEAARFSVFVVILDEWQQVEFFCFGPVIDLPGLNSRSCIKRSLTGKAGLPLKTGWPLNISSTEQNYFKSR